MHEGRRTRVLWQHCAGRSPAHVFTSGVRGLLKSTVQPRVWGELFASFWRCSLCEIVKSKRFLYMFIGGKWDSRTRWIYLTNYLIKTHGCTDQVVYIFHQGYIHNCACIISWVHVVFWWYVTILDELHNSFKFYQTTWNLELRLTYGSLSIKCRVQLSVVRSL